MLRERTSGQTVMNFGNFGHDRGNFAFQINSICPTVNIYALEACAAQGHTIHAG